MKTEIKQVTQLEEFLKWVKTCPYICTISSMQGSFVFVKFFLEERKEKIDEQDNEVIQGGDA
tara:strand:- start:1052 stop:1237 length:186 start_codon:yes stop_codon:yes gene_type:complete